MRKSYILEICAGTYQAALAADRAGATRIELCAALPLGGLTPSRGLIHAAIALHHCRKHILIRPREGDFVYNAAEKSIMLDDIRLARDSGADGIAIGALLPDGNIDIKAMQDFIKAAGNMSVTFHRAFDLCRNPEEALSTLITLGCNRILTSGQATKAIDGLQLLRRLVKLAADQIIIMPGCGVNANNVRHILDATGATEIHASASARTPGHMQFLNTEVSMGIDSDETSVIETQEGLVRDILNSLE